MPTAPTRHHAGVVVLYALAGATAGAGIAATVTEQRLTSVAYFLAAAATAVTARIAALNWRLIVANEALVAANTRLLGELAFRPGPWPPDPTDSREP